MESRRRRTVRAGASIPGLGEGPVRDWFARTFPGGPTLAQARAWPVLADGANLLLVSPTGTGKTLAAFLGLIDGLHREHADGALAPGLRCVYVSPLRSLGYDVEANLLGPLEAIRRDLGLEASPIGVGVRTGDTSAHLRRRLRDRPPHVLITTPESLSLLLSQPSWDEVWGTVSQIILDEAHSLAPTKRGADLAVSVERLAAHCRREPVRVGLSATCRPASLVARFLVGEGRGCEVVETGGPGDDRPLGLEVELLLKCDEAPHRGLTYRRLLCRLRDVIVENRTTVVFANTRAFAEKLTHDLRRSLGEEAVAAHHSALDAARRREVEAQLKGGTLRSVVTSTSLELGVDIGTADVSVLVGLPGGAARCLQRVGRAGHRPDATRRGLILAATPAEFAGAAVTADAARAGRIEAIALPRNPLDVLCQQLLGLACGGERSADEAFALVRRSAPFADLDRADFDACLAFLAGDLAAPAGAFEPEPGASPAFTAPRLWKNAGRFGVRSPRVVRWLRRNVGTIHSEESFRVVVDGREVGTLESAYAERLAPGDRFVLDGRALEFREVEGLTVRAVASAGEPELPRWSSDRQSLSPELAAELAAFREEAAVRLTVDGAPALRAWLVDSFALEPDDAAVLEDLFAAQEQFSEVPRSGGVLVEESPHPEGFAYAFHAPLARSACEALGRAVAARLGRRFGRDLSLSVADLGWSIRLPGEARVVPGDLPALLGVENLADDVAEGLDRGDLVARRFRRVATTALMVLRNPEGGRTRVGGLNWVSQRLYPLVKAACPQHPLIREARREALEDQLDTPSARAWLESRPEVRFRALDGPSPFTIAWLDPAAGEPLRFESPAEALRRLHARLSGTA